MQKHHAMKSHSSNVLVKLEILDVCDCLA